MVLNYKNSIWQDMEIVGVAVEGINDNHVDYPGCGRRNIGGLDMINISPRNSWSMMIITIYACYRILISSLLFILFLFLPKFVSL